MYRHIFVVRGVLETIRRETETALCRETGGPLVGYVSRDGALVVTDAGGPGPRAKLTPLSVTIDGQSATAFCDNIERNSGGSLYYVGDWHRHVGIALKPSDRDISTMRAMAVHESCPLRSPISLIYRVWPRRYTVYVVSEERGLVPLPSTPIAEIPGNSEPAKWPLQRAK